MKSLQVDRSVFDAGVLNAQLPLCIEMRGEPSFSAANCDVYGHPGTAAERLEPAFVPAPFQPEVVTDSSPALPVTPSVEEDQRLVRACLLGDQQAWERLIDKYKRLIYFISFQYHASPEDAADIFQAVCLDLFNSLPRLRSIGSLRAWLITVTVHQSLRWKRKQSLDLELDAMGPELVEKIAVAPAMVESLHLEQAVREAMSQLPPRCRELLHMLFMQQPPLSYAQAAQRLGLAEGSIGFIRGRALNKLRKVLVEFGFR